MDLTDWPDAIALAVLATFVCALLVFVYVRLASKLIEERPTLF